MRRISGLDALIARFRHRWETDRQYRAAMSGIIGVVVAVGMCTCMGIVSMVGNNALAGGGFIGGVGGQQTGGGGVAQAIPSFPTPTRAPWNVPATPVWSPVPNSQTPVPPTPTVPAPPTATPQSCTGVCAYGVPNPWKYCTSTCDRVVVTGAPPNALMLISITYPTSSQPISGSPTADSNGNATFKFAGPHGSGTASISILIGTQTYTFTWPCSDGG